MFRNAVVVATIFGCAAAADAQNPFVMKTYGDGVHAYYRGEYETARRQFDRAISYGSRDPRVYYFRAIAQLQQGNSGAAENDIRTGAAYELQGQGTYDIGMALSRVQGVNRLEFEKMRCDALLDLADRPAPRPSYQPSATDRPLADDVDQPLQLPDDPFRDDQDDAAADDSDLNLGDPDEASDLDGSMDDSDAGFDDGFDDGMDGADDGAADDGFSDDAFSDEAPAMDDAGDDPFADDGGDDPFGEAGGDPPSEAPADGADDPFGGDNPFGDDAGTDDDPFGG